MDIVVTVVSGYLIGNLDIKYVENVWTHLDRLTFFIEIIEI